MNPLFFANNCFFQSPETCPPQLYTLPLQVRALLDYYAQGNRPETALEAFYVRDVVADARREERNFEIALAMTYPPTIQTMVETLEISERTLASTFKRWFREIGQQVPF